MEFAELLRRRTMAFSLATVRFCRTLPRSVESDILRRQLLRSGTSVGANYRSSCRGRSIKEKRAKLGIALEEADESDYWLTLLGQLGIGNDAERTALLKECGELIAIFAASLQTHQQARRHNETPSR